MSFAAKLAKHLRLAYIANDAYDTIALMWGETMLAHWTADPKTVAEYLNPGDLDDWESNQSGEPEEHAIADFGRELTGDELVARLKRWEVKAVE